MKHFLFSTHSNPDLAQEIIKKSKQLKKGKCIISHYKDGETLVHLDENVKGKPVYVLGSTFPPAENILELIILINTIKSNGAKKITLLIPYFGYGKQDKMKYSGDAMSAKLIANIIELAGVNKTVALNLHSQKVTEFFKKPLKHLSAMQLLAEHLKKMKLDNLVIVAPDKGAVPRTQKFAKHFGIPDVVYIKKYRPKIDAAKVISVNGKVKGKNCIIVDDMCQTGSTLIPAAKALKQKGAQDVYVAFTHLLPTGPAIQNLKKNKHIKKVIVTNSIHLPASLKKDKKFTILSCAGLFVKNI